jgi:4-azaleucine resistance transporter AzlC
LAEAVEPISEPSLGQSFRRGFIAMIPLWAGVMPFGAAFAILARAAGFNVIQTQAFSMIVFAGAAQVAAVTLVSTGSSALAIVLTCLLLNLRHVLYGLSLRRTVSLEARPPRLLQAFLLTDEVYGLTLRSSLGIGQESAERHPSSFLVGAGISLYVSFNVATLAGSIVGGLIPGLDNSGFDFIFPLTFLALLVPLLRGRIDVVVALISGVIAFFVAHVVANGLAILVSALVAATVGAVMSKQSRARRG